MQVKKKNTERCKNKLMEKMNYNIMLIGFMGVGKTTVSKILSRELNMPEVDMDAYIVEHEHMAIPDIFEKYGEDYFRKVETECLIEIQKKKGKNCFVWRWSCCER